MICSDNVMMYDIDQELNHVNEKYQKVKNGVQCLCLYLI